MTSSIEAEVANHDKVLFLNIIIHDVSEAVKARVSKKLERAILIPNAVKTQAAHRAADLTSPKYVAQALGQILCKVVSEKLQKKGVTVKMEEVFRENTYVVIQMRILHVNPITMASAWAERGVSWILDSIGPSQRQSFEGEYLPNLLTSILASTIPKMLKEKMSDKKIDAETTVLRSEEQSIYFYQKLKELRLEHLEQRGNRNPIKTMYRRMSSTSSVATSASSLSGDTERSGEESLTVTSKSTWSFSL